MDPDSLPNGGPAFPCDPFIASKPGHESVAKRLAEGMTLRDYFASAAVQGMYANPERKGTCVDAAERAYEVADAMLRARATS